MLRCYLYICATFCYYVYYLIGFEFGERVYVFQKLTGVSEESAKHYVTTDMILEGIWFSVTGACEIYMQVDNGLGTRNAATALLPVNCNVGSGNLAEGIFEGGNDLDGGAATLAAGNEIERYLFTAATPSTHYNFEQDIIVPENYTFTLWSSAIVTINATLVFNYHAVTHG